MTDNLKSLFSQIRFDPSRAFGPRFKSHRKAIMEEITGAKVLSAKCGFNAFMDLCYATYFPAKGQSCMAADERALCEAVKKAGGVS